MTEQRRDTFEGLRLPAHEELPRAAFASELRARLHRRAGAPPPVGTATMAKAAGLEYELTGNPDGEVVLLLHAAGATSFLPLLTEPALAERYRLLRCHRRGFAGSDPVVGEPTIAGHARDAAALLEHLGIDRAHVVGHSVSGAIALQLALDEPTAVRSLALEEPSLYPLDARLQAVVLDAMRPLVDLARSGEPVRAMDRWMRAMSPAWRIDITRTVPCGAQQLLEDAAAFFADVDAFLSWSSHPDRVAAVEVPVLYLLAGRRGTRLPDAVLRRLRELVPHTESAEIPGATHLLHTDQPGSVAAELAAFLGHHST